MVGSPPDKAVGVASSPTSATFFATSAVRASPPQASAEASADVSASPLDAPVHQQSPKSTNTVGSRKRVFTDSVVVGGGNEPNTIRHMVFHAPERAIWFGTDRNTVGRLRVP